MSITLKFNIQHFLSKKLSNISKDNTLMRLIFIITIFCTDFLGETTELYLQQGNFWKNNCLLYTKKWKAMLRCS